MKKRGSMRALILMAITALAVMGCSGPSSQSSEKEILSFKVNGEEAAIDKSKRLITLASPAETGKTVLVPDITVSDKATVDPASGVEQVYTTLLTYTVTAEDDSTQDYTVTAPAPVTVPVTLNLPADFSDIAAETGAPTEITIYKSGTPNQTGITVAGEFDSITWLEGGVVIGRGADITLSANTFVLGTHHITVEVLKNGIPWSHELKLAVKQSAPIAE
jgi:hypothetical protein